MRSAFHSGLSAVAVVLVLASAAACSRKDVDRQGNIKMRGERPVDMRGKREGDLLQKGTASWYGRPYHGRRTSSGERYNMNALTAAHKSLPFGTMVRVVNLDNDRSVVVRINDRGPFVKGRVIDLSRKAASSLGMEGAGTARVALYLDDGRLPSSTRVAARNERRNPPAAGAEPPPRGTRLDQGYWTVQVGSFGERDRAERVAEQVSSLGMGARVERGGPMYRVRAGFYASRDQAEGLADSLRREGFEVWVLLVE